MEILHSLISKPKLTGKEFLRERLIERLSSGCERRLLYISAGPGFGKSVLVSQWIDHKKSKYIWISSDKILNNPSVFAQYIFYALKKLDLTFTLGSWEIFCQNLEDNPSFSLSILVDLFEEINEPIILVIDDFHLLTHPFFDRLFVQFSSFPSENLKLCLITRKDTLSNLNQLRLGDSICEVRADDLCLDEIEIALYSTEVHEVELNEKELQFIQKITEGWLLGINQYLFLCKKNSLVNIDLSKFNLLNLEKIFLEELLENSSPSIIKTLRISSLFDRFSESLLQEVINGSEDELGFPIPCQYIQKLKENNFFLIQLDSEQTWFRFHHLFQAALVKYTNILDFELERESFLKRGSNWFLKHGFFEDAILNALKTQNEEFAISQLSKIKYQLLNTDQYFRLKQIVSNFPLESQERHPELLITKAIILENEAKHEALFQQLRYLEEQVDFKVVDKQIKAEFLIFKGMGSYFTGNFDLALKLLNEGIELNKPKAESICTFANAYKVFSLNALGRYTEAIRFLDRHLDSLFPNQTQSIVRTHVAKALLLSIRGDFNNLEPLTNRILKISREFNYYESQGFALYFLADIYYRQYRFEYLSQIFEDAYEKRYLIRSVWFLKLWAIKAFYFLRIGNQNELDRTIQEINQFSDASNSSNLKHLAEALILEINLQNGKSFFANSSFANVDFELYPPMFYHYFTQNTLLRLLLERDDEQSQNSFEDKILSLEGYATQISHAGALARINILHALKSYRKGETTKSEEYILKAISISEKANDYMVFSEYGIELYHLLNEITPTKKSRIFIDRLRQILKTLFQREIKLNSKFQTDPVLNQRDIKILSLVAEGYSNSEIADQMNLSLNSIKKYLSNIFLILEVKNRTSAILKARDLGIFKS